MKRAHLPGRLALALCALASATAVAQGVPATISFTGNLTNSGAPVSGTPAFKFELFDLPTGGTVAWTENQNLPVANGLVTADLGSVTPFTAGILNGAPLYLQVTINGTTVLTPRLAIQSVPYAIRAGVANNLGPLGPTDVVAVTGNQAIAGTKTFSSPIVGSITGNAATATSAITATSAVTASTVTNGVYTNASYPDPAWITSLGGGKISGTVANATTAASANAVAASVITPSDLNYSTAPTTGQVPAKAATDTFTWITPVTSVGASSPLASSGGAAPTISLPVCAEGQILKVVGGVWACAPDVNRLINVLYGGSSGSPTVTTTTITSVRTMGVTAAAGDNLSIIASFGYWVNGTTGGVACGLGQCTQVGFYAGPCFQAPGSTVWNWAGQQTFFNESAADLQTASPRRGGHTANGLYTVTTAGLYQVGLCASHTYGGVTYQDPNIFYAGVTVLQWR